MHVFVTSRQTSDRAGFPPALYYNNRAKLLFI